MALAALIAHVCAVQASALPSRREERRGLTLLGAVRGGV